MPKRKKKALECGKTRIWKWVKSRDGTAQTCETRWGSHCKIVVNMIAMYPKIRDILVALGEDTSQRGEWQKIRTMVGVLESFELFLVLILSLRFLDTRMNLFECL